jgi:hypothetical protein
MGKHGHFLKHFRDAIGLYEERRVLYSQISDGLSDVLFRRILFKQKLAQPLAAALDLAARPYQKAGIPLLELDFVDMSSVPAFSERFPGIAPARSSFYVVRIGKVTRKFWKALGAADYSALEALALDEIKILSQEKRLNALYRHLIESLARMASLAPQYEAAAREKSMSSPRWILKSALALHIAFLREACRLDEKALELQCLGIPILVQDLPPIPLKVNLDAA